MKWLVVWDMLEAQPAVEHWKASGLDLSAILYNPPCRDAWRGVACRTKITASNTSAGSSDDRTGASRVEHRTIVEIALPIAMCTGLWARC